MISSVRVLICRALVGASLFLISWSSAGQTAWKPGPLFAGPVRFEFAIYYLGAPTKDPLAVAKQRIAQGSRTKLVKAADGAPTEPVVSVHLITNAQKEYRPPHQDLTQRFGRGLTHEQAVALEKSDQALVLDFANPVDRSFGALKAALSIAEQIARDTNGLLWDEETREVFTPEEWHKRRVESWSGELPDVSQHTVIHAYKANRQVRAITLGMAKFGLPDVVIDDFSWSMNRSMGNLINAFSQVIAEGQAPDKPGSFELDLKSMRHPAVKAALLPTLKPNSAAQAHLTLVQGVWESGDPQNPLIEIRFDRYPGPDAYARQEALTGSLFGYEDPVARIKHDEELMRASQAAVAKLPALREAFLRGLQPGEYILVKAPFAADQGGQEWMWVEVMSWQGDQITGLLRNEPVGISKLHGGQTVKVSMSKVFDYLRRYPDGREEGNETSKIIARIQAQRP